MNLDRFGRRHHPKEADPDARQDSYEDQQPQRRSYDPFGPRQPYGDQQQSQDYDPYGSSHAYEGQNPPDTSQYSQYGRAQEPEDPDEPWIVNPVDDTPEPEPRAEPAGEVPPQPRPESRMRERRHPVDDLSMPVRVRNRNPDDAAQATVRPRPRSAPATSEHTVPPQAQPQPGHAAAAMPIAAGGAKATDAEDDWRGGTWQDSGYSATDEEAHRDRVYEPPNFIVQTLIVMFAQMKQYAKGKATFILIGMIALMPVLVFLFPDYIDMMATTWGANVSNSYTGFLLALLPPIMALFTARQCGTQIPMEFKERTAYMSIPLPMHRLSFYFGKYLAGFLYCLALFLLAFGVAVACTEAKFDSFYIDVLLQAFVGTVVAILVYSSTAYCIGCFMNRGSVLIPLVLNLLVFPLVFFYLTVETNSSNWLLMPMFLPDAVVQSMGFPVSASIVGMANAMFGGTYGFGNMWLMCGLGVLWGAALLALGAYRITRREM